MVEPSTTATSTTAIPQVPSVDFSNYIQSANEAISATNSLTSGISSLFGGYGQLADKLIKLTETIPGIDALNSSFEELNSVANNHSTAIALASTSLFKYGQAIASIDQEAQKSTGFRSYASQLAGLSETITDADTAIKMLRGFGVSEEEIAEKSKGGFENLKKSVMSYANALVNGADQQKAFKEVILSTAASTGYTEYLERTTNQYEKLNEYVDTQRALISRIGAETGVGADKAMEFYMTLRSIPGIMQQSADVAGKGSQSLFQTVVEISQGSKIPLETLKTAFEEARKSGNLMDSDLKNAGTNAAQYLASMTDAASKLKIEFSEVSSYADSVGKSFKYFGSEGISSIKILGELMPALQGTGLSAQNSRELIQGMVNAISSLSEAQKGFISQQTGGPGGLQGAFQIDMMLREGKLFEVFQKVKETMTQQMGPLVSLKEASGSQEAAAQYERQQLMLRSGPLGKLVEGIGGSERLIDAMKAAQEGNINPLKEASESLKDMSNKSENNRNRDMTILTDLQDKASMIRDYNRQIAQNTLDSLLLVKSTGGRQTLAGTSVARDRSEEFEKARQRISAQLRTATDTMRATYDAETKSGKITPLTGATGGEALETAIGIIKGSAVQAGKNVADVATTLQNTVRETLESLNRRAAEAQFRYAQQRTTENQIAMEKAIKERDEIEKQGKEALERIRLGGKAPETRPHQLDRANLPALTRTVAPTTAGTGAQPARAATRAEPKEMRIVLQQNITYPNGTRSTSEHASVYSYAEPAEPKPFIVTPIGTT